MTYLLTAVTDGSVLEQPTRSATGRDQILQAEVTVRSKLESVRRMVTVLVPQETAKTQIVVLALGTTNHAAAIVLCPNINN